MKDLSLVLQISDAIKRFEDAWCDHVSQPPQIRDFLPSDDAVLRSQCLPALIRLDIVCRASIGMPREVAEYFQDFPELEENPELGASIVFDDYSRVRDEAGVDLDAYCERFPDLADRIRALDDANRQLAALAAGAAHRLGLQAAGAAESAVGHDSETVLGEILGLLRRDGDPQATGAPERGRAALGVPARDASPAVAGLRDWLDERLEFLFNPSRTTAAELGAFYANYRHVSDRLASFWLLGDAKERVGASDFYLEVAEAVRRCERNLALSQSSDSDRREGASGETSEGQAASDTAQKHLGTSHRSSPGLSSADVTKSPQAVVERDRKWDELRTASKEGTPLYEIAVLQHYAGLTSEEIAKLLCLAPAVVDRALIFRRARVGV